MAVRSGFAPAPLLELRADFLDRRWTPFRARGAPQGAAPEALPRGSRSCPWAAALRSLVARQAQRAEQRPAPRPPHRRRLLARQGCEWLEARGREACPAQFASIATPCPAQSFTDPPPASDASGRAFH
ncbi:unnamed protein product [Prorocentrum cordatum]|uniref:Uncharacterized protein n=1 Tax=Prorocentrum cordatum TaxID=2364126 RepID=A0ABN9QZF0_9DINO|nr:unnamed protein product [Polarella glacialis]